MKILRVVVLALSLGTTASHACPLWDGFESYFVGQQYWGQNYYSLHGNFGFGPSCDGVRVTKVVFSAAGMAGFPPAVGSLVINGQQVGAPVWIYPGLMTYQLFMPLDFNELGYQVHDLGILFQGNLNLYDLSVYSIASSAGPLCERQEASFRVDARGRGGVALSCPRGCRVEAAGFSVPSFVRCTEESSETNYRVMCRNDSSRRVGGSSAHAWATCAPR